MPRRKAKQSEDDAAQQSTAPPQESAPEGEQAAAPAEPARRSTTTKEPARKAGKTGAGGSERKGGAGAAAAAVAATRTRVAQLVWLVFVVCALLLAVGALLVALDANARNSLVRFVLDGANLVDLGIFSRDNGIKEFRGEGAQVKNALLNWGLGAVAYLVVGKIVDRLIRP